MPEEIIQSSSQIAMQLRRFILAAAVLMLAFAFPLWKLVDFALHDRLFSFILLIPMTSIYLAWLQKGKLPHLSPPAFKWAVVFFAGGLAAAIGSFLVHAAIVPDSLVLPTLAFVLFLIAMGFTFLGGATMHVLAFPFTLLIFMVPFPNSLRDGIETWLQHGSATVAGWMFALSGLPVLHDNLMFHLPSITLKVAPECSGIHSTLVLFIVSLVAGHLFLNRPWKSAVLCLAIIPLALLRNGFRIFVLGELCTHIGPEMIDSPIHHRGGPIFFALSLIPFSLLLYFLMKSENTRKKPVIGR